MKSLIFKGRVYSPRNVIELNVAGVGADFFDIVCQRWIAVRKDRREDEKDQQKFQRTRGLLEHEQDYNKSRTAS